MVRGIPHPSSRAMADFADFELVLTGVEYRKRFPSYTVVAISPKADLQLSDRPYTSSMASDGRVVEYHVWPSP